MPHGNQDKTVPAVAKYTMYRRLKSKLMSFNPSGGSAIGVNANLSSLSRGSARCSLNVDEFEPKASPIAPKSTRLQASTMKGPIKPNQSYMGPPIIRPTIEPMAMQVSTIPTTLGISLGKVLVTIAMVTAKYKAEAPPCPNRAQKKPNVASPPGNVLAMPKAKVNKAIINKLKECSAIVFFVTPACCTAELVNISDAAGKIAESNPISSNEKSRYLYNTTGKNEVITVWLVKFTVVTHIMNLSNHTCFCDQAADSFIVDLRRTVSDGALAACPLSTRSTRLFPDGRTTPVRSVKFLLKPPGCAISEALPMSS
mmetsp:Transcript_55936/g.87007  ORF Transcript_55936/g.87007 Transcript_55936/m.87007 type:complete len:312 (+) Transcript_55936:842-1777(+)